MPNGKPAGVRCIQLDEEDRCRIFGQPERPAVCGSLEPSAEMCGDSREQAPAALSALKQAATSGGNTFAALMDAVRCCSLGQISDAFFEVGGQYRRNV